jgi:hypothetical protein
MTMVRYRGCAFLLPIFVIPLLLAACASPVGSRAQVVGDAGAHEDAPSGPADSGSPPAKTANETPAASEIPPQETPSGDAYALTLRFQRETPTYFVIENDFRDVCGFPPLLTVTTSVKEKRSIIQRVLDPTPQDQSPPPRGDFPRISWECDRYEILERGLKEETSFDSLRDLYPPPSLWPLGGIPGSVCTFLVDPRTGKAFQFNLRPAHVAGGSGSAKLSRTAERCALTEENLQKLLDDFGPFYFPDSPKRIGEEWTKTYQEDQKAIGVVTTKLTCTLRSVRDVNGRKIATIAFSGETTLKNKSASSREGGPSRTDRPTQASQPNQEQHYVLDKADCSGTIEFDLTQGELAQLKVHRELEFFAPIETTQQSSMVKEIRSGWAQDLRVTVSHTPPPKPVIVGGPKPPVVPADTTPGPSPTTQPSRATPREDASHSQHTPATQPTTLPARPRSAPSRQHGVPAATNKPKPPRPERAGVPAPPAPATSQPTRQD